MMKHVINLCKLEAKSKDANCWTFISSHNCGTSHTHIVAKASFPPPFYEYEPQTLVAQCRQCQDKLNPLVLVWNEELWSSKLLKSTQGKNL